MMWQTRIYGFPAFSVVRKIFWVTYSYQLGFRWLPSDGPQRFSLTCVHWSTSTGQLENAPFEDRWISLLMSFYQMIKKKHLKKKRFWKTGWLKNVFFCLPESISSWIVNHQILGRGSIFDSNCLSYLKSKSCALKPMLPPIFGVPGLNLSLSHPTCRILWWLLIRSSMSRWMESISPWRRDGLYGLWDEVVAG